MSRHKKYEAAASTFQGFDISSLIDVCFLLLIYFIVTSTITPREADLGMTVPQPRETVTTVEINDPLLIQVRASGAIFVGEDDSLMPLDSDMTVRDLPLLSGHLSMFTSAARAGGNEPLVHLAVDTDTQQQRVMDVLNALAKFEIKAVTFTDWEED